MILPNTKGGSAMFDSGIGGLTVLEALLTLDVFNNDTLQPGSDGVAASSKPAHAESSNPNLLAASACS